MRQEIDNRTVLLKGQSVKTLTSTFRVATGDRDRVGPVGEGVAQHLNPMLLNGWRKPESLTAPRKQGRLGTGATTGRGEDRMRDDGDIPDGSKPDMADFPHSGGSLSIAQLRLNPSGKSWGRGGRWRRNWLRA